MAERFDISALEGSLWPIGGTGNARARGGITYTVHDRAYLHRAVALYRSEDFAHTRPRIDSRRPRSREQALAAAEAECDRLNAKHPEGWPAHD